MVWDNKIVWSEGMFLRAQHFQQFDRYVEALVDARTNALCAYGWGVTELDIDRDLLGTGKLALRGARGVLPDGTPFHLPEQAPLPTPIEPAESVRNCTVYLALPLRSPGRADVALPPHEKAVTRYAATPFEATDAVAGSNGIAQLQVGQLRLRLMLGSEDRSGYAYVGVARIVEVLAGRGIVLDRHYIPPSLVCAAAPQLAGFLAEMHGPAFLEAPESEWLPTFRSFAIGQMMEMIRADLIALGIEFDVFSSERALSQGPVDKVGATIEALKASGEVYEGRLPPPKGAPIEDWEDREQTLFRSTAFGDDVDRPLKKSDGSYTYFAGDIAYHKDKVERGFLKMIDV